MDSFAVCFTFCFKVDGDVRFEALEASKRPVNAVADHTEFRNVVCVDVAEAPDISLKLLFDPHHALDERILAEQFRF